MKKVILSIFLFASLLFAEDKFLTFEYLLKPIPEPPALALLDTANGYTTNGIWCFKFNIAMNLIMIDRNGEPAPFNAVGAGITYQREINQALKNYTTFEAFLGWIVKDDYDYGPGLMIGIKDGYSIGGMRSIKSKLYYALVSKLFTLSK